MSTTSTTVPVQIRIDKKTREEANILFKEKQCVLTDSIPLKIKKPHYNQEVLEAIEEAEELAKDPNAPKYETVEELFAALEAE